MIAALILAGGQGTRLGGVDKAFVALHGRPLIEHLLERLRPQVRAVAISANGDAARFAAYGLPVLPDAVAGKGPLAGVVAGLRWAEESGAGFLLTVPVDTVFVPLDLAESLAPGPSVAVHGGREHYLVALWPVGFLAALENFLAAPGAFRVRDALALAGARRVGFLGDVDPFLNINTPEDLRAAEGFRTR